MVNYRVEIKNMTDDMIKEIQHLDSLAYNKYYSFEWYKERYNQNNIIFCIYEKQFLIGYLAIPGIKEKLYNDIKSGKYADDYDFGFNMFDYNSKYLYIASINVLERYRHQGLGSKLIEEAFNYYKGNYSFIAITVSVEGYRIARKYMKYIKNITNDIAIFERI